MLDLFGQPKSTVRIVSGASLAKPKKKRERGIFLPPVTIISGNFGAKYFDEHAGVPLCPKAVFHSDLP